MNFIFKNLRWKGLANWMLNIAQVLLIYMIWLVAGKAASFFHLPISGGVSGLLILVVLLLTRIVRPAFIEKGAELLLANMMLYFVPLVVSVIQYMALFESAGFKLMIAIGVGFTVVMLVTAVTVEWFFQWTRKRLLQSHIAVRKQRMTAPRFDEPT